MKIKDAVKELEKKQHNEKVDRRRKKLKKLGGGVKKVWDYLGDTELAHQNKKKKDGPNRFGFEDFKW